jgi:hypothetical protein
VLPVSRTRRSALVLAVLGVAVISALTQRVAPDARGSRIDGGQLPACHVGGDPTHSYGERPPESFLRYATRPVVIGCAVLASGRRIELVAYQLGRGKDVSLCIDHYFFDTRDTWGCGSNVVHGGGAIDATSTVRDPGHPAVVSGTARTSVARVVVRSEVQGRLRRHRAAVVTVRDRPLLRAIGVERPFRRYLAEVPSRARAVTAEAFDARPRTLGIAFFPGFREAIGEGRGCYTQPRVTRMRLLDPARVGKRSRLRVVAVYRAGYIGSIDVGIGGRVRLHADLAPTPNASGRRWVVTLPVGFRHRGATFIDVTADGVPLSRRCGPRPPLRSSPLRTLGLRVR